MRSILGTLLDRSPIPIGESSDGFQSLIAPKLSSKGNLAMMGSQSTVFPIVDRLATSVAAVQWRLYRSAKSGKPEDREVVEQHPALLLWRKPNPFTTGPEFVEAFIQHYELTGEWWWTLARAPQSPMPLEMWAIRPDRMDVVRHPTKFITGYMYSNGSEDVPLATTDVIYNRRPNPMDRYRGISPLEALSSSIDTDAAAADYNLNFFRNGAEPGGMIKVPRTLSDADFQKMLTRWRLSHRGTSNAHRVGVLENAEWVPASYSQRDMQFEQLRRFSREDILEAWGMPKALLGEVTDVNRANAESLTVIFANWLLVPRLNRIRASLNDDLLPLFGSMGRGYEFDYVDPTPPDKVDERADMTARVQAAAILIGLGFNPTEVLAAYDLPALTFDGNASGGVQPVLPSGA